MSDFFGKRGRRLHVGGVITSQGSIYINKFQVDNFVLLFNSCTQNRFAVNFAYYLAFATYYQGLTSSLDVTIMATPCQLTTTWSEKWCD